MQKCIGIDLGTTRSAIAYVNASGRPEIIRNEQSYTTTPSMIYFGPEGPIVGELAKKQRQVDQQNVVQLFKREIDQVNFLFNAYNCDYSPIDLSALLLAHLKGQAQRRLQCEVKDAVITVPAYFTDPQRKATIAAGVKAGLNVLTIINEPTAAALAYRALSGAEQQRILVFDLGGGTFDLSIVQLTPEGMQVEATDGDHHLGGIDWDAQLLGYVVHKFEHEHPIKLTHSEREALHTKIEQAKHLLSARQDAPINIEIRGLTGKYSITRGQFEELTRHLMMNIQMLTERVLKDKGFLWSDIDGVLPVGGASRMAMIRNYIERVSGKPPISGYNPEEIVALGAALQASQESGGISSSTSKMVDVTAHSMGMISESTDRTRYLNSIIIPKNSSIPCTQTRPYRLKLRKDGKTQLEIFLTQGEDTNPEHCTYLGRYLFTDFPQSSESRVILDIIYEYDKNAMVQVSAMEHSTQRPLKLTIQSKAINVPGRFLSSPAENIRREPMTVYLAVDLSGSMEDSLAEVKKAALSFVDICRLPTISIGLLSFADKVKVHLEATTKRDILHHEIEKLAVDRARGYANNDDPFAEIHRLLSQAWDKRYALVLTDGRWGLPEVARERAKRCHDAQIEIFAVGYGSANREFLAQIASSAEQGILINMNQLVEAFSTIAQEIIDAGAIEQGMVDDKNQEEDSPEQKTVNTGEEGEA